MKTGKGQVGAKETVHKRSAAPVQAAAAEPGQAGERLHRPSHEQRRENKGPAGSAPDAVLPLGPHWSLPHQALFSATGLGDRQLKGVGGERGDGGAGRDGKDTQWHISLIINSSVLPQRAREKASDSPRVFLPDTVI